MFTSTFLRRHIYRLPSNTLFSTKELLKYGKRAAVDQALSRLVKRGDIIRLARGLFRREDYNIPLPTNYEVAACKANAFNKIIVATNTRKAKTTVFITNGRSSSFRFGNTIIRLKGRQDQHQ